MTNWLTLEETAQYLKMGKSTIYDFARKGKVPRPQDGPGVAVWRRRTGRVVEVRQTGFTR